MRSLRVITWLSSNFHRINPIYGSGIFIIFVIAYSLITSSHRGWVYAHFFPSQTDLAAAFVSSSSQSAAFSSKTPTQITGQIVTNGPLFVHPINPRYFTDGSGRAIYLTGSHTWANFQDSGGSYPPEAFNYSAYLDFMEGYGHNFMRLWAWEQAKWGSWLSEDIYFSPSIYPRNGPGTALDGKPKFSVTQFNQAYFDRLRARIIQAGDRGVYVSIMLFDGWSTTNWGGDGGNPWLAHPYNASNNINGINGDPNGDNQGTEIHTLQIPAVTALQEAYVRKVIDTVNDLDNVLYEISNESFDGHWEWQYHMINFIKDYENTQPKQHPVGMTYAGGNDELFNSPADWISPGSNYADPPANDGSKVIVSDTDHIWGIGGDRQWVWKSFVRGLNTLFMDPYNCSSVWPPYSCDPNYSEWVNVRNNMGYTRAYANRMNLAAMTPRSDLCSTQYCLASPVATGAEYLVYSSQGGTIQVNLSATSGELSVEWLNPATGAVIDGGAVAGGAVRSFTTPFSGDAVLYLYQSTQDTTPPQITNVTASRLDTVTQISWTTDEPATSQVVYGLNAGLTMSTAKITSLTTSHTVTLTGLTPDTLYYFAVRSEDGSRNQAVSSTATFTTLKAEDVKHVFLPAIVRLAASVSQPQLSCYHNR